MLPELSIRKRRSPRWSLQTVKRSAQSQSEAYFLSSSICGLHAADLNFTDGQIVNSPKWPSSVIAIFEMHSNQKETKISKKCWLFSLLSSAPAS